MGRVVLSMSVSLDGFFEGPDHDISWHRVDDELHRSMNELIAGFAGEFIGRRTYELMEEYWPTADEDPRISDTEREFAEIYRGFRMIVYSRTLESVRPGSELRRALDAAEVRALVAESERDFGVGGGELASEFLRQGLVDEIRLNVNPLVIGAGTRLFPPDLELDLRLIETRSFGDGVVLLRYEVL